MRRKVIFPIAVVLLSVIASAVAATAQPSEFDLISKHIQKQYQAKKVGIPTGVAKEFNAADKKRGKFVKKR